MDARAGPRAGRAACRPRAGVRGAGDADGFPRASAAGRCARGHGGAARMPPGQPGGRPGGRARWPAPSGGAGAAGGAGRRGVPPPRDPGGAVRTIGGTRNQKPWSGCMIPLTMLLQATEVAPLPDEGAAAATGLPADPGVAEAAVAVGSDIDMLQLIQHASIPVQTVMLLLLAASIASWVIIFRKKKLLDRAEREADRFEERFWSGSDMGKLYAAATERNREVDGLEAIFEAGFREFSRQRQRRTATPAAQLEGAQRGMRVATSRELDGLEHNLEFLANVGSIAPYVGLLGTVWGIMISFQGLANVREATIATVAPGISEALIATAMGLFAAIPAVWAYNRYATKVERIASRYESFADEFSSILERQAYVEE